MGAIILRRGRVLLVERGREPLKGCWSLPGGALETGESLEDGVRREVFEETGLEVKPLKLFEVFERITRDDAGRVKYHYVLADFLCRVVGGELRPGDDVSRAVWVKESELDGYRITEGTAAVIRRAFHEAGRA